MNCTVTIDWEFVVALGAAAVGIIFAVKMDASAAERVSIHAIDSGKGGSACWKQRALAPTYLRRHVILGLHAFCVIGVNDGDSEN